MKEKILGLLTQVEKPSRYFVTEYNACEIKADALRFAMCFPDLYEVGMSNLGLKLLYHLLNSREGISCERCFAPWKDMGALLKSNDLPLFTLESFSPLSGFDICGFSLQYEMSYSTVLYMLDLAGIPARSCDRGDDMPVIIAGGPCCCNPAPLDQIFDLFVIGDGEDITPKLCEILIGIKRKGGTKAEFLSEGAKLTGVYAPGYSVGTVTRAIVEDLDSAFFPTKPVVAGMELVHDRMSLEVFRGCTRGCRFCQAGFIYRPVRERKRETLVRYAKEIIDNTGYEELSLSSLSTCDYSDLRNLLGEISGYAKENRVSLALPSLRVDSFEAEYTDASKISSLTFAPEAGSQRLRDVINKNITDEDILRSLTAAFERGYSKVKLYYMLGLPTETDEDVEGIVDLCKKIREVYRSVKHKGAPNIAVSTSTFIPKPFTPFEREPMAAQEVIATRQNILRSKLKNMGIKYNWHDYQTSLLETVFARGDSRLNNVIIRAAQAGARFDGWTECFDYQVWKDAFEAEGISFADYLCGYGADAPLPWDNINMGIDRQYLLKEAELAKRAIVSEDCRNKCAACGISSLSKCFTNSQ